jgi:hypothetical protein
MARPKKQTVDYFPHDCVHKKTMYILESKYNVYGYTFWFKLLELLGSTPNHFYDCTKKSDWEYLVARTLIKSDEKALEILNLLADLDAIDKKLWDTSKIIWSQNFVDRISDLYTSARHTDVPQKPKIIKIITTPDNAASYVVSTPDNAAEIQNNDITTPENPQIKLKESKVNQINNIPDSDFEVPNELFEGILDDSPTAAHTEQNNKKSKHSPKDINLHNQIKSYFIENHGKFYSYPAESEGIYRLIKFSRQDAPGLPEFDFIIAATQEFIQLKDSGEKIFNNQPCLPSVISSQGLWPRIMEFMKRKNLIRGSPVNGESEAEYYERTMKGVFKKAHD